MANRNPGDDHPTTDAVTRRQVLRYAAALGAAGAVGSVFETTFIKNAAADEPPAQVTSTLPSKTSSTLYPIEKVESARKNIADGHDWAIALRDAAVQRANSLTSQGDEWLWQLVPGQKLPRSLAVNRALGSPITGREIDNFGTYPWQFDVMEHPWKLIDPSVDQGSSLPRIYPTNDFGAYYRSALDENGLFDPERGDRSLLVNELYPERGPDWGVDDGYGWIDDTGNKWPFIAYYTHWALWVGRPIARPLDSDGGTITAGLAALRDAYIYTGDVTYARAGLILLDRIADVYPAMDVSPYGPENGFDNGSGAHSKLLHPTWEAIQTAPVWASSYDAFFPALATDDEAGVVQFLAAKAEEYGLPAKNSTDAIRVNIENGILREIYPAVKAAKIRGNFGTYQAALATAAVVLDDPTESKEWIDFVFASGQPVTSGPKDEWRITGGNIYPQLVDVVDRDGFGNESAPGYNRIWINELANVADALGGYPGYPSADLYQHPKYAAMIRNRPRLTMLNQYIPSIGDSGTVGAPGWDATASEYVRFFEIYGDPIFAQLAYLINGNKADGLYSGIYSPDASATQDRIREIIHEIGPLDLPSENLAGYGLATLRAGQGAGMRGAWLYYGRTGPKAHPHLDALNLGMHGLGVDLLPDLGYPTNVGTGANARRNEWEKNTISHNTVMVDEKPQAVQWVGQPHGFGATERVQFMDVSAPMAYPETSLYRRAVAQVMIDERNSYVVDVFRVKGGNHHHFSFHAAEGPVTVDGLQLTVQATGTYAGPDIEQPPEDDPPRDNPSGFAWLGNVERHDEPAGPFTVDWAIRDTWNVHQGNPDMHLRFSMLSTVDDVALCDGVPAQNKVGNPESLRYLIAHRQGEHLASQFVSVIEPYVDTSSITSMRSVVMAPLNADVASHEAAGVRVELSNGRVDYIVNSLRTDVLFKVDGQFLFRGSFGLYSLTDGRRNYAYSYDATLLGPAPQMVTRYGSITGTVTGFTTELSDENVLEIDVNQAKVTPDELVGAYVYVSNDGERNAVYQIHGARLIGRSKLELNVGNTTFIRSYIDAEDFDQGYVYDLEIGAPARIPLARASTR